MNIQVGGELKKRTINLYVTSKDCWYLVPTEQPYNS